MKSIKNLFILCFMAISVALSAQTDAISKHFASYVNNSDFNVIYISPQMMDMIAETDENTDKDVKEALENLSGLRILTTAKTPGEFYENAVSTLGSSDLKSLMNMKSANGENVNFFVRNTDKKTEELLLVIGGEEFVMLSMEGDINLRKVSKLAKALDIKGAEHLEELKNQ